MKTTRDDYPDAHEGTAAILRSAGLGPVAVDDALNDPRRVVFKPIYDLGTASGMPSPVNGAIKVTTNTGDRYKPTPETRPRIQYGIRPDGRMFEVALYTFTETDLVDPATGRPVWWHDQELSAVGHA